MTKSPVVLHPFAWLRASSEGWVLGLLGVAMVATSLALAAIGAPLHTAAAPQGIVSFEFAATSAGASAILDSWNEAARQSAMLVQGLDYLYLVLYPAFFSLACVRTARRRALGHPALARAGLVLAWAVLAAAVFDAVENWALIRMLVDGPSEGWARIALWCAVPKFALVGVAALYVVAVQVMGRLRSTS